MTEKLRAIAGKYGYAALILLAGVLLMVLPGRSGRAAEETGGEEVFSLSAVEAQMEETIGRMEGVGRVKVMLTLRSGPVLQLASDRDVDGRGEESRTESQIVRLNRGSGVQEVVVTRQIYPTYQGAVVVCDGAGSSAVCLAVTETVAVLTGLSSDRITVVKWKS